jgi:hypothetical protein
LKAKRPSGVKGKNQYQDFLEGKHLTRKEAMLAKCYECMGFFEDGKQDCLGKSCPLYRYYPYRS